MIMSVPGVDVVWSMDSIFVVTNGEEKGTPPLCPRTGPPSDHEGRWWSLRLGL